MEYAMEEARRWGRGYVGTEHVLLGLMREREGVAAQVLMNFGLDVEGLRKKIEKVLAQPGMEEGGPRPASPAPRLAEGQISQAVELPQKCPQCGDVRIVRVIWNWVDLVGQVEEEVAAGRAILGPPWREPGPPWVCLRCAPGWLEVHRLVLQDHAWQLAKEAAVADHDFEEGVRLRDAQRELRSELLKLLEELVRRG